MYAGIPASPISTGYVRARTRIPARLRALIDVLQPFAAFVPDARVSGALRRRVRRTCR